MALYDLYRFFNRIVLACLIVTGTTVQVYAQSGVDSAGNTENEPNSDTATALTVEGISVTGDDDYPRVLNILPWQPPTVSRRARDPLRMEHDGLLEPVDPEAMERHRQFRQTLDPLQGFGD